MEATQALVEHGVEAISNGWNINADGASRLRECLQGFLTPGPRKGGRWNLNMPVGPQNTTARQTLAGVDKGPEPKKTPPGALRLVCVL